MRCFFRKTILLVILTTTVASCMKDEEFWKNRPELINPYNSGLFIINQGNFTYENASLSYYNIEEKKVYNNVFFNTNGIPLGDVALSMNITDSIGYIIINNSGRMFLINTNTFVLTGKITGFTSPRFIHFVNPQKAYVTDLYAMAISIVNPVTLSITGEIDVKSPVPLFYQHPTEQMIAYGNLVFTNCWSYDNKILVIDTQTDRLIDSITVIKQPFSMVIDRYEKIWVICDGGYEGSPYGNETPGLVKIDAKTREIEKEWLFNQGETPRQICINGQGDTIYFINRHVYRMDVVNDSIPDVFVEQPNGLPSYQGFNGLTVDPFNSEIFVADAFNFTQAGVVYRFAPSGTIRDSFKVGIIPGGFCFRKKMK